MVERDGWIQVRQKGSPRQFHHPSKPGTVTHRRSSVDRAPSQDFRYNQKAGGSSMKFAVIYEAGPGGYSAYAPDLPGCVAAASTLGETRDLMEEAIEFHIDGMRLHGEPIPEPSSLAEMLEIAPV